MTRPAMAIAALIALALAAGCGDSGRQATPKVEAKPIAETKAEAQAAPKAETADSAGAAKADAPDTHGMPGMADLFKGDDKSEKK